MAIGSLGSSINNAYFTQAKKMANSTEQNQLAAKDKAVLPASGDAEQAAVANKQAEPETHYIKSFAYGALGMDKPSEAGESEDNAYGAGQLLKAVGTVGSIIAVFV